MIPIPTDIRYGSWIAQQTAKIPDENELSGDGMRYILVIDDDKSICSLLRAFLTKMGYQVEVAHDGQAGIEYFDNGPDFDLVITDIRMPKMDGSEVARHIRGSDRPATPIVAITGFSDTDIRIGFFDSLLLKPFDLDALKDIVTSLTENSWPPQTPDFLIRAHPE